jgi:hypothetical protein
MPGGLESGFCNGRLIGISRFIRGFGRGRNTLQDLPDDAGFIDPGSKCYSLFFCELAKLHDRHCRKFIFGHESGTSF